MADAPGYVDLQVNGYASVDFNSNNLRTEELALACQRLRKDGVAGILATVVTDEISTMCRRLENIRRACEEDVLVAEVVWGIHIEGPFLNDQPGYIGAHPAASACDAEPSAMNRLLDASGDLVRIVTLAPERDRDFQVIRMLADRAITVSAGHCNLDMDQLSGAIDAGLSMFTHLGNACPKLLPRHENIIQTVLSRSDRLWISFIADGIHVPLPALGNYLRAAGIDRSCIVTDAVSAAGCGPGTYPLADRQVVVDEHLGTWSADGSHLVGSAATMPHLVDNLRTGMGLAGDQIEQLTSTNPRKVLGLE